MSNLIFKSTFLTFGQIATTLILELTKVLYLFQTYYGWGSLWYTFWVLPHWYTRDTNGTSKSPILGIFGFWNFNPYLCQNGVSYHKKCWEPKDCFWDIDYVKTLNFEKMSTNSWLMLDFSVFTFLPKWPTSSRARVDFNISFWHSEPKDSKTPFNFLGPPQF